MTWQCSSRRSFIKRAIGASADASGSMLFPRPSSAAGKIQETIGNPDHVATPIQNVEDMEGFYRALGFGVMETEQSVSIHFGAQKVNFHPPSR